MGGKISEVEGEQIQHSIAAPCQNHKKISNSKLHKKSQTFRIIRDAFAKCVPYFHASRRSNRGITPIVIA